MTRAGAVSLLSVFLVTAGCGSYFVVREPVSGTTYCTRDVKQEPGGVVTFRDERTGAFVTLRDSEVRFVTKEEYMKALNPEPPVPAAPVPAAAEPAAADPVAR